MKPRKIKIECEQDLRLFLQKTQKTIAKIYIRVFTRFIALKRIEKHSSDKKGRYSVGGGGENLDKRSCTLQTEATKWQKIALKCRKGKKIKTNKSAMRRYRALDLQIKSVTHPCMCSMVA